MTTGKKNYRGVNGKCEAHEHHIQTRCPGYKINEFEMTWVCDNLNPVNGRCRLAREDGEGEEG